MVILLNEIYTASESDLWFVIFLRLKNLYLDNVRILIATFIVSSVIEKSYGIRIMQKIGLIL